jgi:hypothetical protein
MLLVWDQDGCPLVPKGDSRTVKPADSDEDAQAFRFDGALDSDMMSPRTGASLAGDWWHR